jgi:hypothetical protein
MTRFQWTMFVVFSAATCFRMAVAPAVAQPAAPTVLEQSMNAVPGPRSAEKYDGVVPGPNAKNPLPSAPGGGIHLVWTGFQMTDVGSRVFLQTTTPVEFDVKEGHVSKAGKSTLEIRLHGCRIYMANNRRKIDTRFFATPVSGLSARQKHGDVEVLINLREVVNVTPRHEAGPDGTQFLVLDFPPGKATIESAVSSRLAPGQGDVDSTRDLDSGSPDDVPRKSSKPASKSSL